MAAPVSLTATAAQPAASAAPSPKLVKAAHEFEAQMMKELLAPMTGADADDDALFGEGDDAQASGPALGSGSGSGGALAGFASEALGQALSERGGFGIADQIIRQLGASADAPAGARVTSKVTQSLHGNTVMRKAQ